MYDLPSCLITTWRPTSRRRAPGSVLGRSATRFSSSPPRSSPAWSRWSRCSRWSSTSRPRHMARSPPSSTTRRSSASCWISASTCCSSV